MPASIWLAFVCCTKIKEKTKKVRNPGLAESKDQSLMRPKGPQARPCHCSWRVFLTSGVSSLCGELNQNNPGHLICRTRIPREKRRGPGRKERKAFPESTGSPRKLAFASYVSFLTLLSKEYAARFCDRYRRQGGLWRSCTVRWSHGVQKDERMATLVPSEACSDALNLQVVCRFITSTIYKQASFAGNWRNYKHETRLWRTWRTSTEHHFCGAIRKALILIRKQGFCFFVWHLNFFVWSKYDRVVTWSWRKTQIRRIAD